MPTESTCSISLPQWHSHGSYEDILYHKAEGIAKITINRPEVHNAFRPLTIEEISKALQEAREDHEIGVIILTGSGKHAFCSLNLRSNLRKITYFQRGAVFVYQFLDI